MSLNWNISNVKNWKDLYHTHKKDEKGEYTDEIETPRKDRLGMFLECFIWSTMAVDLGEITEGNVDEWLFRLEALRITNHSVFNRKITVTRPIVERFIGLKCNVCSTTRRQFLMRVAARVEEQVINSQVMRDAKSHQLVLRRIR